jgi:hypothetical protein
MEKAHGESNSDCLTGGVLRAELDYAQQRGDESGKWLLWYHACRDFSAHVENCETCKAVTV